MPPDEKLLCSPEERVYLEIANQAEVLEFLADFVVTRDEPESQSPMFLPFTTLQSKEFILVQVSFATLQLKSKL